jgi:hypothetical protein
MKDAVGRRTAQIERLTWSKQPSTAAIEYKSTFRNDQKWI